VSLYAMQRDSQVRHEKGACDQHAQIKQTPTRTKGSVDVIIAKKGGFGTRRQASPNPHTTHIPEAKAQVVYE
jgi:hypothetical protein